MFQSLIVLKRMPIMVHGHDSSRLVQKDFRNMRKHDFSFAITQKEWFAPVRICENTKDTTVGYETRVFLCY